jgi:hypothetical protein
MKILLVVFLEDMRTQFLMFFQLQLHVITAMMVMMMMTMVVRMILM